MHSPHTQETNRPSLYASHQIPSQQSTTLSLPLGSTSLKNYLYVHSSHGCQRLSVYSRSTFLPPPHLSLFFSSEICDPGLHWLSDDQPQHAPPTPASILHTREHAANLLTTLCMLKPGQGIHTGIWHVETRSRDPHWYMEQWF